MKTAPEPTIRSNVVIALGDLAFRFPNLIEPYTPNIYGILRDKDTQVRKNTLMVLSHLILNDMIKVTFLGNNFSEKKFNIPVFSRNMWFLFFLNLKNR